MMRKTLMALALLAAFGVADAAGPRGGGPGMGGGGGGGTTTPVLSIVEATDLTYMRQEEKMARDVYLTMYALWQVPTFSNIASSEQSHMDAIMKLLQRYGLPDPAAGLVVGEFRDGELQTLYDQLVATGSDTELAGLQVGGLIEEVDMLDIADAIQRSTKADIDEVYGKLLCGSRNHLRAFAAQIEVRTGTSYVAQVMEQAAVDAIVDSPRERCD
jgi:hypothetical protein